MTNSVEYRRSNEIPGLVLSEAHFSSFRFERHYHLDYHVALVTKGVQRQGFHGDTLLLTPGTIQLMPPAEIHDGNRAGDGSYTLKTFRVPCELLSSITEEVTGQNRFSALGPAVLQHCGLAGRLSRLHDTLRPGKDVDSMEVQSEWLLLLSCLFSQAGIANARSVEGKFARAPWERVREYCDAHLAEKITLEELAALCGLERFHFLKVFKRTVGMTPHAWLVRLRLERACSLLRRPDPCLTQVAVQVGFYDQSHFNRAFRRAFGVSPSQY